MFARTHLNRDFVSVLVYFPADRFGPETRRRVQDVIVTHWPGELIARDDRIVELDLARMQFLIALRPGTVVPSPDRHAVEEEVLRVTRRWSDDLADLLTVGHGEEEGERLARRYDGAFPEAYKEDFGAATAVDDLKRLESLPEDDGLGFHLYTPTGDDDADRRLKVFRTGRTLSLARALPIFTQMGIEVLDERPYEIARPDGAGAASPRRVARHMHGGLGRTSARPVQSSESPTAAPRRTAWIYDFGLRLPAGVEMDADRAADVVDTLRLLWRGEIEQDGFNGLVLRAQMSWWQANVLRAYAKYLRQAGTTFSQGYIEQALIDHPAIARKLVRLFESRFDPGQAGTAQVVDDGQGGTLTLVESIEADLAAVESLDQDRILRSLLRLISATLRTNAYRTNDNGNRRTALALKLEPRHIPELPEPRPRFEIWVYSPRVEGVHLRFGLDRPRRPALVGPPRGFPHRGPRPGQGADGEERRHRARSAPRADSSPRDCLSTRAIASPRRQSWPKASPATGRSSPACSTSPTTTTTSARSSRLRRRVATTATIRTSSWRPTRARRRSPTSRTPSRSITASGSATRSRQAARRAMTTRRWASPRGGRGSR